jgi:transposase
LPTLAPGSGKTQKAWLWAYARDNRPFGGPVRPWLPTASRTAAAATASRVVWPATPAGRWLAYTRLAKAGTGASNETVTLAGCWVHLRRRFYELHLNGSSRLATQTVTTMAALWKIEGDIRGLAPAARMAARQQRSAAIVAELFNLWEMELPRISGKSKLAEAIRYATSRRKVLECFLTDGRVEIDSNIVERAIRPQKITRKNALFAGSDGAGRTWQQLPP